MRSLHVLMIRKTYSESTQIRPRTAHTPTVASHVDVFILGDCTGIDGSIDRDRLHPISAINVSIVTKFRTTAHEEAQRVKTTSKSSSERRKCCFMTLRLFFTSQSPHQRTLAPMEPDVFWKHLQNTVFNSCFLNQHWCHDACQQAPPQKIAS